MARSSEPAVRVLVQSYVELYPEEVARQLDAQPPLVVAAVLQRHATRGAAAVLERLLPDTASQVIDVLDDEALRALVPAMEPPKAAALLARLEPERQAARLALLDPQVATELRALMEYAPDSAGGIMDPGVTALRPDSTAKEARALLRKLRGKRIHHVFVVDDDGRLVGAVSLQELAAADASARLQVLSTTPPLSVPATAAQAEVVDLFEQHKLTSLPVTDFEGRLVGIIRHEALVTALQVEASADIQMMVGASRDERALSTVTFAVRKRLPWLQINLATAFLAAFVVAIFEGTIARYTALAVLLPVAAGQSGNTGAQALAVTMRGLALREIRIRHWLRLTLKEFAVGLLNGIAVALVTALAVYTWSRSLGLSLVIGLAMVTSMVIAGIAGASVPMVLTLLRQDPAQASSIILTTVTDVAGFLSFLGLATLAAGML